jgi:prevent-host-death family protein
MTMVKSRTTVAAGDFKARCLALLDEVAESGTELIVTKRGRPVARVVPVEAPPGLSGSVVREDDLISPIADPWTAAE